MALLAQLNSTLDRYFEVLATAQRRALHSYFHQHIVQDRELGYFALDEGDYNALPRHLAERVVHTLRDLSLA